MRLFTSLTEGYERAGLRRDVIAGLTVWAVLVPEALAYASIAGVSPVVGLYAAPAALVFYAAFGSSRHLVTGPMAATAALSAAAVGDLAAGGSDAFVALTVTLALVVGVLALVAGLLRLGFLASFISEPVLKGFIIGLALTIIVGQLPKLFGVEKDSGDFFEQLRALLESSTQRAADAARRSLVADPGGRAHGAGAVVPGSLVESCSASPLWASSASTSTASRSSVPSTADCRHWASRTSPRGATWISQAPRSA